MQRWTASGVLSKGLAIRSAAGTRRTAFRRRAARGSGARRTPGARIERGTPRATPTSRRRVSRLPGAPARASRVGPARRSRRESVRALGRSTWQPRRRRMRAAPKWIIRELGRARGDVDPPSEYPRGTRGGAATRPRRRREKLGPRAVRMAARRRECHVATAGRRTSASSETASETALSKTRFAASRRFAAVASSSAAPVDATSATRASQAFSKAPADSARPARRRACAPRRVSATPRTVRGPRRLRLAKRARGRSTSPGRGGFVSLCVPHGRSVRGRGVRRDQACQDGSARRRPFRLISAAAPALLKNPIDATPRRRNVRLAAAASPQLLGDATSGSQPRRRRDPAPNHARPARLGHAPVLLTHQLEHAVRRCARRHRRVQLFQSDAHA